MEVQLHQQAKDNISAGRKKFLSENPDKHPWRNPKNRTRKSAPTERVKEFLRSKGMSFVEEHTAIPGRFFSADIAFPDIKYAIEVNGNQHYNRDGTLKPYYAERHQIFVDHGWTVLELHYSLCFNDELLEKVITLRHTADYSEFVLKHLAEKQKKIRPTREESSRQIKQKTDERWKDRAAELRSSGIDFSKFGWVGKVSIFLGILPQKVNKWMKRHLPDVYEIAFKRKSNL